MTGGTINTGGHGGDILSQSAVVRPTVTRSAALNVTASQAGESLVAASQDIASRSATVQAGSSKVVAQMDSGKRTTPRGRNRTISSPRKDRRRFDGLS